MVAVAWAYSFSVSEVNENPSEVFVVLLETMVERADVWLIEKTQHAFLELATAFARDNLYQFDAPVDRLLHNTVEFGFDFVTAVVDVVQVQFQLCHESDPVLPPSFVWHLPWLKQPSTRIELQRNLAHQT